jgi:hypothetical protein
MDVRMKGWDLGNVREDGLEL